jgi:Lhr-like helicase
MAGYVTLDNNSNVIEFLEKHLQRILKVKQREVLLAAYEGKDVLGVLPTGYGKSVIIEALPAVGHVGHGLTESLSKVLVINPLNAIIQVSLFYSTVLCNVPGCINTGLQSHMTQVAR